MKLARRLLMLMLVMLVAFAVTACGGDDDDDDSKDSKKNTKKSASFSNPEELVDYYVTGAEEYRDNQDNLQKQCELFSNETALKKLDMYDEDDLKSPKYSWEIKKTKEYGEDDDVTEGVKAYVRARGGDEEQIQSVAITEVSVTTEIDDEKEKTKYYFTSVKVGGKWYILDDNSAENINDMEDKWAKYSDRHADD